MDNLKSLGLIPLVGFMAVLRLASAQDVPIATLQSYWHGPKRRDTVYEVCVVGDPRTRNVPATTVERWQQRLQNR
jgi:hypothetical protein